MKKSTETRFVIGGSTVRVVDLNTPYITKKRRAYEFVTYFYFVK